MLKVDLKKELNEKVLNDNKAQSLIVNEAKLLLEGREVEEREVLRALNLDTNIRAHEAIVGESITSEKIKSEYGDDVFTEDQIRSLCLDYNLRFLRANRYAGSIDPMLASKILTFCKQHDIQYKSSYMSEHFMIMAPKESFRLQEKPVDPLMFYSVGDGRYKLIHKWGNDFSITRFLTNYWKRTEETIFLQFIFMGAIITTPLLFMFMPAEYKIASFLTGIIGGGILGLITCGLMQDSDAEIKPASGKWNSDIIN